MNERIRQLAEQAGFMDSWFSESGDDCEQELKKFAELIVQECAGRVDHILRERQAGGGTMGDDIREYFGVEE
jgi:hypothetical protein